MIPDQRLHSFDNLRALAMLSGVLFHAALAYSPLMHPYWLTADRGQWVGVDVVVWFLHLFRMPLFFAIAGFFAARQVAQRGPGGLLRNRAARVLLPLLLFWPVVTASFEWLIGWATVSVVHVSPLLQAIRDDRLPVLPPSLSHLWFLYYLMLFYLLVWIAKTVELKVDVSRVWALPPFWLAVGAPLLLIPSLASVLAPTPAPEGVLPQLWALAFYGLFFAFGYALHTRPQWLSRLGRLAPGLAIGSLAAYVGFLWTLDLQSGDLMMRLVQAGLQACVSVWMTLWCLQAGDAWLSTKIGWLRYLADSSYWTYLVHLPLLFAVQIAIMDWDLAWPFKLTISLVVTFAVCLLSYQFTVRHTLLGRLLNGKPRAPILAEPPVRPLSQSD